MPVRFQKECDSGAHVLVWEAREEANELLTKLPSSILTDSEYFETHGAQRRRELLISRIALRYLAKSLNIDFVGLKKDEHGKPYMPDSNWQISITHSKHFIAVIMHPSLAVGIDIERPRKKMWNILPRLYSEQEISDVNGDLSMMSIYWSAKEALYKLYGKRGINFKDNLKLHKTGAGLMGEIIMPLHHKKHQIHTEQVDDYILVWTV